MTAAWSAVGHTPTSAAWSPAHRLCWLLPWLGLVAACSTSDRPRLGTVSGVITLDGVPLPGAMVSFRPAAGGQVSKGTTDDQGSYRLTYLRDLMGAAVGSHVVTIRTVAENAGDERLPPRYNSATSLSADVTAGANRFDFPLSSAP